MTVTPTYDELLQGARDFFSSRVPGLTNYTEGSTAGMLTAMIATELRRVYDLIEQAEAAWDVTRATGADLDNLARPYGILRRSARAAGADSASPQVMVTNNSSAPISLPPNLAFWSPSDPSVRLYLASPATIGPGQSAAVFVRAQSAGQTYSVGTGQLTANNGPSGLVSSNFLPVSGGSAGEDDESFRYRITQTLQSAVLGGASSLSGVESALLAFPGVLDAVLVPQARGPATLDAVVVAEGNSLPDDDFLTSVQEEMARVCAAGVSVRAKGPTVVPVSADVSVSSSPSASLINPAGALRTAVTAAVRGYLDSRTVGLAAGSVSATSAPDVSYASLLAAVTDACTSVLGSSLLGVTLVLSLDGEGEGLQGDLYARPSEVFRSSSVSVRLGG